MSSSNWNPDDFKEAWNFATIAHHGQTFGGPEEGMHIDYLNHIGSVVTEVIWALNHSAESDAVFAIHCAILHDVIEDTHVTYEDIRNKFGQKVASGVLALTKNISLETKEEQMKDSLARIKLQPYEVWIVKMADRITNLYHPPYYWDNGKISSYQKESTMIWETLKDGNTVLAERLLEKIREYSSFLK